MPKPRVLLLDIETSPITGIFWSLFQPTISHDDILQDWYIFCACYKWLGEDKVHSVRIKDLGDDKPLCEKLREVVTSADAVIYHNGSRFDKKKLNARLIQHRIKPIPQIAEIDTLKEVKKVASFSSHRLDYLAKVLTGEGKLETKKGLWKQVLLGNKKALSEMVLYCERDVDKLEEVYEVLKPYFKSHPHLGVMSGKDICSCPKCSSTNLQKRGLQISAAGNKKQRLQCQNCGGWSTTSIK